jgi:hypothetical protein
MENIAIDIRQKLRLLRWPNHELRTGEIRVTINKSPQDWHALEFGFIGSGDAEAETLGQTLLEEGLLDDDRTIREVVIASKKSTITMVQNRTRKIFR